MIRLLLIITFLFLSARIAYSYPPEVKKDFLEYMELACGGKNRCLSDAEVRIDNRVDGDKVIYFSCQTEFDNSTTVNKEFNKCLSMGARGFEKILRKYGKIDLADKYIKKIEYCESRGDYNSQFMCLKEYLRTGR